MFYPFFYYSRQIDGEYLLIIENNESIIFFNDWFFFFFLNRETTISTTAEVTSKYHFAAHMGQLINGIDNTGCHNFYPGCPFPGLQVMQMMKKVKIL